jgi:hypothetical protein
MVRPTNFLILLAILAALLVASARWQAFASFLVAPIACGVAVAAYNLHWFSSIYGGYPSPFGGHWMEGLAGILFSPSRGLFIYSPILALGALALLPRFARRAKAGFPLLVACTVFVAGNVVVVARWPVWWGGYSWGPRLLSETVPFLIVMAALAGIGRSRMGKAVFAVLLAYSVAIQALGVYFYPKGNWNGAPVSVDRNMSRLWDWRDNPISRTACGGLVWEPYAIMRAAIRGGLPGASRKVSQLKIHPY